MAIVEQLFPDDSPVVSVGLTHREVKGLVTLLGSGTDGETLSKLDLGSLYVSLNMLYPEYRHAEFGWQAELEYVEKD